jgi:hypothetical protein
MDMNVRDASPEPASPIDAAARKTVAIRKQLQVAGAELHLTNAALERHLPPDVKRGDIAHALAQRGTIEEKVLEAADELSAVRELLDEEQAERARLQQQLAEAVQGVSRASK